MQHVRRIASPLAIVLASTGLLLTGCGNGLLNIGGSTISTALATTPTSVLITDAPADQVLSLSLMVDSIVVTDKAGKSMTVLSTPVQVEVSHLDAVLEQLLPPMNIPQDTYVSATFKVANPVVVYIDPTTGKPVKVNATLSSATDTVTFATPIVVSATSTPICIDLLVGQSVSIVGSTVTMTPTFNVTQIPVSAQPTNSGNGRMDDLLGQVVSVSGTTLTVGGPNGQTLAITTNSATQLQGFTALSLLTAGQLVAIDLAHQASGSLLAMEIRLLPGVARSMFGGPITATTGTPVTSFTEVVRQPLGPLAPASTTGATYTVNLVAATTYALPTQLPSLPFSPVFSAATLFAGQNVRVTAANVSGTTVTADSVTLATQTVNGVVAAQTVSGGVSIYTVTLPAQSALATLTGKTSVVVYVGTATQVVNKAAVVVGSQVRFNGLLFNDKGTLRLVAGVAGDLPGTAPPNHP